MLFGKQNKIDKVTGNIELKMLLLNELLCKSNITHNSAVVG